jgi:hypothetical protein
MHEAIASPHTPERRGSHFVGGILRTVLHDSIASPKVVQQEITEGMDDLVPEGIRNSSTYSARSVGTVVMEVTEQPILKKIC